MGNFMIPQQLFVVEVSYQAIPMALEYLDQNLPLMEEYDLVIWTILVVISPISLDFLGEILSLDETILEFINIMLHPLKDIFCGATWSMIGLNSPKYRSILCMFLDLIRYIWKHAYMFILSICWDAFEPFCYS